MLGKRGLNQAELEWKCLLGQNGWMGLKNSGGIQEPHVGPSFREVNPLFLACREAHKHASIYTDNRKESKSNFANEPWSGCFLGQRPLVILISSNAMSLANPLPRVPSNMICEKITSWCWSAVNQSSLAHFVKVMAWRSRHLTFR